VHSYCPTTRFELGFFECGVFEVCKARYIMCNSDVPKEGVSDHEEEKSSKQEAKALNQATKDMIALFNSP